MSCRFPKLTELKKVNADEIKCLLRLTLGIVVATSVIVLKNKFIERQQFMKSSIVRNTTYNNLLMALLNSNFELIVALNSDNDKNGIEIAKKFFELDGLFGAEGSIRTIFSITNAINKISIFDEPDIAKIKQ